MTYETFKTVMLERISNDIPNPKHISIQTFYKNNGFALDGLVILENGCNISPALYLDYYYEQYQNTGDFQEVYEELLEHYLTNKTDVSIDPGFFTDFQRVKPKIVLKLINYEKNRSILEDVPHIPFLDLAAVFYYFIPMDSGVGNATILIHNSHLEIWNESTETLFQFAKENSPHLLPPIMKNINSLLEEYFPVQSYPSVLYPEDPLYPMFVLTNEERLFGASCMLYEGLLQAYAQKLQSDLYILPSSIHELILVPTYENNCMCEFSEMICEVNRTQVAEEEVLSDHAYYYSREQNQILM